MSREAQFIVFCIESYKIHKALTGKQVCELFEKYGVKKVVFGHLHGPVYFPLKSEKNGVEYHLTSCDKAGFKLVKIY